MRNVSLGATEAGNAFSAAPSPLPSKETHGQGMTKAPMRPDTLIPGRYITPHRSPLQSICDLELATLPTASSPDLMKDRKAVSNGRRPGLGVVFEFPQEKKYQLSKVLFKSRIIKSKFIE